MWRRLAEGRLRALRRQFPAVTIVGARQVGKTTLARRAGRGMAYADLEDPRLRDLFAGDPVFAIESRAAAGLILDEAQLVPSVFAALRGIIDRDRRTKGRFLLLGSAQPALVRSVAETLAGRTGILELPPLTAAETASGSPKRGWQQLWLRGGFPDALKGDFREWWEAYLRTYVERDLPRYGVTVDPLMLRRLLTMLAHAQGGLLNASQLGGSLGVSYHTVQRYLDVLEQTFLLRRLPPYHRNIGKRLTRSPKVYLRDTGLLHHLLHIDSLEALESHPSRGASWETFVIEELIRRESIASPHTQFFFWRTAAGAEIDLVLDRGSERTAVEIKAGHGGRAEVVRRLADAATDISARAAWILDQGTGEEPLARNVTRRGYGDSIRWLPP